MPLLRLFLSICLLSRGPEDVPASQVLLRLCLATYALSGVLGLWVTGEPVLLIILDMVLMVALLYGVLAMRGYRARFEQTLTAVAGTGTLLSLIYLPFAVGIVLGMEESLKVLLFLGLIAWNLAVLAHILQHALSTTRGLALIYSMVYVMIYWTMAGWLLPQTS